MAIPRTARLESAARHCLSAPPSPPPSQKHESVPSRSPPCGKRALVRALSGVTIVMSGPHRSAEIRGPSRGGRPWVDPRCLPRRRLGAPDSHRSERGTPRSGRQGAGGLPRGGLLSQQFICAFSGVERARTHTTGARALAARPRAGHRGILETSFQRPGGRTVGWPGCPWERGRSSARSDIPRAQILRL